MLSYLEQSKDRDPYKLDSLSREQLLARLDEVDEKIADLSDMLGEDDPKVRAREIERDAIRRQIELSPDVVEDEYDGDEVESSSEQAWETRYGDELRGLDDARQERDNVGKEIGILEQTMRVNIARFASRPELARQTNAAMQRRVEDYKDKQRSSDDMVRRLSIFEPLVRETDEPEEEFALRRDIQDAKIDLYYTMQALDETPDDFARRRLEHEVKQLQAEINGSEDLLADRKDQRLAA